MSNKAKKQEMKMQVVNQPSNELRTLNNATNIGCSNLIGENTLMSYLGRVNYDFKGKYLL